MSNEFQLSITEHAVTSGSDANCFFESFFHTLTNQSPETLGRIQSNYPDSVAAFVDTFNNQLGLNPAVDFAKIMDISRKLHPFERESVFGSILRQTYNTMITRNILQGTPLKHDKDAILNANQTHVFANAFGAQYNVYMNEEQFKKTGMPPNDALRVGETRFQVYGRTFYHDCPPDQKLKNGKQFELNIVWADSHLNFTLGTRELNREFNAHIMIKTTKDDRVFSTGPAPHPGALIAPLTKKDLSYTDIIKELCQRFNLTSTKLAIIKTSTRLLLDKKIVSSKHLTSSDLPKTFPLITKKEKRVEPFTKSKPERIQTEGINPLRKSFKK